MKELASLWIKASHCPFVVVSVVDNRSRLKWLAGSRVQQPGAHHVWVASGDLDAIFPRFGNDLFPWVALSPFCNCGIIRAVRFVPRLLFGYEAVFVG